MDRNDEMLELRKKGWTLKKIGERFGGLSRQRIHQILVGRGYQNISGRNKFYPLKDGQEIADQGSVEVSNILKLHGIANQINGHKMGYDLLVDNKFKVEVKTKYEYSPQPSGAKNVYHITVFNLDRNIVDYFIFYIRPCHALFIIPQSRLIGKTHFTVSWPSKTSRNWIKEYYNRFELLYPDDPIYGASFGL